MLLELRMFSLLDLLLDASQRLGCPRIGLGRPSHESTNRSNAVYCGARCQAHLARPPAAARAGARACAQAPGQARDSSRLVQSWLPEI